MSIDQGFVVERSGEYQSAFATAVDAGFDYVELNMEARFSRNAVDPTVVRDTAADFGLDLVVHLPYTVDIGSPHEHARKGACRELEACIDTAAEFGAETAVLHAQSSARHHHWERSRVVNAICESIQRLYEYAAEQDIIVCAENLDYPFIDITDFPELFAQTDTEMCLDTGHAFASGMDGNDQAAFLQKYGDRISHIHLNDTRIDQDDEHLPVGLGRVSFLPLAEAIVEVDWEGTCTHEVFGFDEKFVYVQTSKQRFDTMLANFD